MTPLPPSLQASASSKLTDPISFPAPSQSSVPPSLPSRSSGRDSRRLIDRFDLHRLNRSPLLGPCSASDAHFYSPSVSYLHGGHPLSSAYLGFSFFPSSLSSFGTFPFFRPSVKTFYPGGFLRLLPDGNPSISDVTFTRPGGRSVSRLSCDSPLLSSARPSFPDAE